ncbi:MAG: ParB N-terminal domain-containing protein [Pseudomonadota bacterium]
MSRKRLGAIDPSAAREVRESAEQSAKESRRAALGTAPPIAQVAGEVGHGIESELARLREENRQLASRTEEFSKAEAEGRLVHRVPLDDIDAQAILRDRSSLDRSAEEWDALKTSLKSNGQQTPVELVPMSDGEKPYGLVTGLRRLSALLELRKETGDTRFDTVLAFVRPPRPTADKLVAMIEENEIRLGISFYERGRICVLAAEADVFPDTEAAIGGLFASSNRNRRYKIRCFATIHEVLGSRLKFPEAIGERLGIAIAQELRSGRGEALVAGLDEWRDALTTSEKEVAFLGEFVGSRGRFAQRRAGRQSPVRAEWKGRDGARVTAVNRDGKVAVTIEGLSDADQKGLERLVIWLGARVQPDR